MKRFKFSRIASFLLFFLGLQFSTHLQANEVKIGNDWPYSGAASFYLPMIKTAQYYFEYVNENKLFPRKIKLISLDNKSEPPRSLENARKMVERDKVDFVFMTFGTPWNAQAVGYYNKKKVPHLLLMSSARQFHDPKNYPYTVPGIYQSYYLEGKKYGEHILKTVKNPKVGVIYQNENFGKDYLAGLRDGLGPQADKIVVKEQSYEISDTSIDTQVINIKNAGANVFCAFSSPKFSAQAFKKIASLGVKLEAKYLASIASSIQNTFMPAGLEESKGVISSTYFKDPRAPSTKDDAGMQEYLQWCEKWTKQIDCKDNFALMGYTQARIMMQILEQAKTKLTRENIMAEALKVVDFKLPVLLDGISINISSEQRYPISKSKLTRFNGKDFDFLE